MLTIQKLTAVPLRKLDRDEQHDCEQCHNNAAIAALGGVDLCVACLAPFIRKLD